MADLQGRLCDAFVLPDYPGAFHGPGHAPGYSDFAGPDFSGPFGEYGPTPAVEGE